MKIYLRKKNDSGKTSYILETKVDFDSKQKTIYLATLPPLEKLLEWITGKASNEHIEEKVQKSLKASSENKRQDIDEVKEHLQNPNVLLLKVKRTDAFSEIPEEKTDLSKLTKEERERLAWELSQ